jgi:hypothetical protein
MKKQTALNHFKTIVAIAAALGISRQAVNKWGAVVPWAQAIELQHITGGTLQRDPSDYIGKRAKQ